MWPFSLHSEPCPPTNVQASMSCRQLTSTASWQQSDLALGYVAYFDNQNGHYTSCMSTNTSCVVSGLMCGTVYSVWVKALGQQYNSSDSSVVSLTSGKETLSIYIWWFFFHLGTLIYLYFYTYIYLYIFIFPQPHACPETWQWKSTAPLTMQSWCPGTALMAQLTFPWWLSLVEVFKLCAQLSRKAVTWQV